MLCPQTEESTAVGEVRRARVAVGRLACVAIRPLAGIAFAIASASASTRRGPETGELHVEGREARVRLERRRPRVR